MAAAALLLVAVPTVLTACASRQAASEDGPDAPPTAVQNASDKSGRVFAMDDSARVTVVVPDGLARVDTSGGGYVVWFEGGRLDAPDLPSLRFGERPMGIDSLI